jgi:glucosyl-dolichyl phosphate glucuronosyltransferase
MRAHDAREPRVSVVLCTYNRAESLEHTLTTLARQSLRAEEFEVLVVDNASTDHTNDAVERVMGAYPHCRIHLLTEPRVGHSHARNTGLSNARAPIIAFTDDDVLLPHDWLHVALDVFRRTDSPDGAGGPVLPLYSATKPAWFKDAYETNSWGDRPRRLRFGESFIGNNMLFRADVLRTVGSFNPALGMSGDHLGLADDTDYFDRIWFHCPNAVLHYDPRLQVQHVVPAHRMNVGYIARRLYVSSQTLYIRRGRPGVMGRSVGTAAGAAVMLRGLARSILRIPRYRSWQQWVVEEGCEVIGGAGLLTASLGIRPAMRERERT